VNKENENHLRTEYQYAKLALEKRDPSIYYRKGYPPILAMTWDTLKVIETRMKQIESFLGLYTSTSPKSDNGR
jgi:hypothetical protein